MFILDTDTLTHLHARHPRVVQNFHACTDPDIGTTIITRIEIIRGRFEFLLKADTNEQFLRAQRLLLESEQKFVTLLVVPLDVTALNRFQALRPIKGLRKIRRTDVLIASIALANNAMLATRNSKDFKLVPGLKLTNWVD
jgi:tRNA(fMet)-specific endonuclease VapC